MRQEDRESRGRREEEGRGRQRGGWGGRVSQTRCSQAHTSSLCHDLLSVWILFRSNRPLQKRICLISSLPAIYDIAGELKWSHPPTRWEVHYTLYTIWKYCPCAQRPQHNELSQQRGCATVVWTGVYRIKRQCIVVSLSWTGWAGQYGGKVIWTVYNLAL